MKSSTGLIKLLVGMTLVLLLVPGLALTAATYYVATNGNDNAAGTIGAPWASVLKAFQTANAGDTVYFRQGAYTVTEIHTSSYHNGTSGSPITFMSYPGETATWSSSVTYPSAAIWLDMNYVTVKNLSFTCPTRFFALAYDSGSVVGFTADGNTFTIGSSATDNSAAIQIYPAASTITITNNRFIGPGQNVTIYQNAIQAFRTQRLVIRNNEFSGWSIGIFMKHSNVLSDTGCDWSYNYFHDNNFGISSTCNYCKMENNIFKNSSNHHIYMDDDGGSGDGGLGGEYNTFNHNTLIGGDMNWQNQGNGTAYFWTGTNNVFVQESQLAQYTSDALHYSGDYNLFPTGNMVIHNRIDYSLTAWRTFLGGCPGTNRDCNSISGTPTFVGGSNPSTNAGFALTSGSTGHNAASDGTDMGANVSLVGVQATSGAPKIPSGVAVH
jgi:hypothetical protein